MTICRRYFDLIKWLLSIPFDELVSLKHGGRRGFDYSRITLNWGNFFRHFYMDLKFGI
jgi:hypothetical protein